MQAPEYFATAAVAWKPLAVPSSVQYQHLGDVGNLDFFFSVVNCGLYLPLVKHSWVIGHQQGEDMKGRPSRAHPRSRRIRYTEEGHFGKLASLLLQLQLSLVPGLLGGVPSAHYHQVPEWEASLNQQNDKFCFLFSPLREFCPAEIRMCPEVFACKSRSLRSLPS